MADEPTHRPGTIVWTDLTVPDAERLARFYSEVAGWQPAAVGMGEYDDFNMLPAKGDAPVAGICHARGPNANLPPQWLIYICVSDVAGSARHCVELGGKVVDGPRRMGDKTFCVIQDPAGAVAALIGSVGPGD